MVAAVASGNGAANAVASISGTATTKMLWPENSIPSIFTVCSVTRYTGTGGGRILSCAHSPTQNTHWLHGHHRERRGVAQYAPVYDSTAQVNVGVFDDWLVMCGSNAGTTPGNIVIDQSEIGTAAGGGGGCRMNINYVEESDHWALHSVLIWDYSLGTAFVPWRTRPCLSNLVAGSVHGTCFCGL